MPAVDPVMERLVAAWHDAETIRDMSELFTEDKLAQIVARLRDRHDAVLAAPGQHPAVGRCLARVDVEGRPVDPVILGQQGFYPTYRDAGDDVEDETAPLGAYLASCSDAISANGHLLAR